MLALDLRPMAAIRPPVREDLRGTGAPPRWRRPLIAWGRFEREPRRRRRRRWPWVSLYVAGFSLHVLIWIYVFSLGYGVRP